MLFFTIPTLSKQANMDHGGASLKVCPVAKWEIYLHYNIHNEYTVT